MPRRNLETGNYNDVIDLRDITDRVEELRDEVEGNVPGSIKGTWIILDEDGAVYADVTEQRQELATLESLLSELKGYGGDHDWEGDWYPGCLIRDSYFTSYAQELCEDIGDIPSNLPSYIEIDWEATARNIQQDYSSVEYDGVTYWYR